MTQFKVGDIVECVYAFRNGSDATGKYELKPEIAYEITDTDSGAGRVRINGCHLWWSDATKRFKLFDELHKED